MNEKAEKLLGELVLLHNEHAMYLMESKNVEYREMLLKKIDETEAEFIKALGET